MTQKKNSKILCPYTERPMPECYCVDMNSSKVQFVLEYCHGPFHACRLYQAMVAGQTKVPRRTTGIGEQGNQ